MSMTMIGDMRQFFVSTRSNTLLKTELNHLVEELSTGQVRDITSHLGTAQTSLANIDRRLALIEQAERGNAETGRMLATMQVTLEGIDSHRGTASSALLTINGSSAPTQIEDAAGVSRAGFDALVLGMNARFGDRSMFGGNDTQTSPLASPDDIFAALQTATAGLTTAADVAAAVTDWFDAPGGGFETVGYQSGATGMMDRVLDDSSSVQIDVRADDPAIRDALAAFAMGALAVDMGVPLAASEQRALQQQAGVDLLEQAVSLASLQARLGYAEGQVEEAAAGLSSSKTAFSISRNELVSADPFETASKLEVVQSQLQTHYTLTARLSRLSLTEYLR